MNISDLYSHHNTMGKNEKLEIDKNWEVRKVHFDNNGKRHTTFLGIIENSDVSHQPIKNKLWASGFSGGLQSFSHFGQNLPKRKNESEEIKVLLAVFEAIKEFAVKSIWTDSYMKFTYDVLTAGGISVYYYKGTPRYVEKNGKKLIIDQVFPDNVLTVKSPKIKKD